MSFFPVWARLYAAALCTLLCVSPLAQAGSALLVWPVDPVIEHDERAAALWIENRGTDPALLQLRIFAWGQEDGENNYATQSEVVGTPPMLRIEPGQRQLVRLTRVGEVQAGTEWAYRVILDEIPTPTQPTEDEGKASAGLKFQMRYSIPLFVQGQGLWTKERPDRTRNPGSATQPVLEWRTVAREGHTFLEIHNRGLVHARLTEVVFLQGQRSVGVADGMLGYVLAGKAARWPLPKGTEVGGTLMAKINGAANAVAIPPRVAP